MQKKYEKLVFEDRITKNEDFQTNDHEAILLDDRTLLQLISNHKYIVIDCLSNAISMQGILHVFEVVFEPKLKEA